MKRELTELELLTMKRVHLQHYYGLISDAELEQHLAKMDPVDAENIREWNRKEGI
tara:strand:+ start:19106 stop:19270 length:165 start_codon:yes stop_codon:yes gene_type:complete